jgi:hypothetical protein
MSENLPQYLLPPRSFVNKSLRNGPWPNRVMERCDSTTCRFDDLKGVNEMVCREPGAGSSEPAGLSNVN